MDDPLTIPEAARHLKIGVSTLRRYLRRRLLSHIVLPGNDYRIEVSELEVFKKARTIPKNDKSKY
ncbi:MAG TPA: helix-turn-helix domain-containing protein [Chthoniobacterales bacterium]